MFAGAAAMKGMPPTFVFKDVLSWFVGNPIAKANEA
jgi:hypothetical protein